MKASTQRRRSKAQIKEEKKTEERKQKEIAKKLAEYDEMERKIKEVDQLFDEKENYRKLCSSLYDDGVIKQDNEGNMVPVEDPLERESIKSKSKIKM